MKSTVSALGLVLLVAGVAHACPNCSAAIAANTPAQIGRFGNGLGAGFNWSIYTMIAVPYLTFFGLTFHIVRLAKKHQRMLDMAPPSCDPPVPTSGVKES
jgi:hypothetical protein